MRKKVSLVNATMKARMSETDREIEKINNESTLKPSQMCDVTMKFAMLKRLPFKIKKNIYNRIYERNATSLNTHICSHSAVFNTVSLFPDYYTVQAYWFH